MIEYEDKSFLINEELIRIQFETYEVFIVLQASTIQLGGEFAVWHFEQHVGNISPVEKAGDPGLLWSTIGAKVLHVVWNSKISIEFDNGTKIVISKTDQAFRGTLLSGRMVEEF